MPLLITRNVPLVDYPTHLARMHILHEYASNPFMQMNYDVSLIPRPNLAMDLCVIPLAYIMPVEVACKFFVGLTLLVVLSGVGSLGWVAMQKPPWINLLFGAVFLYNWIYAYGFMNFLFGVGLLLWFLALWLRARTLSGWWRICSGGAMASALYLCHLVPFVIFITSIAALGLRTSLRGGRIDMHCLGREGSIVFGTAVPVILGHLHFSGLIGGVSSGFQWCWWPQKAVALCRTPLGTNLFGDVALMGALFLTGLVVLLRGRLRISPELSWILGFGVCVFWVSPDHSRLGFYLNERLVLVLLLLSISAMHLEIYSLWPRRIVVAALLATVAVRSVVTTSDWIESDAAINRVRDAFGNLEGPAVIYAAERVAPVELVGYAQKLKARYGFFSPPVSHIAAYASLEKDIFAPIVYADPVLQPIRHTDRVRKIADIQNFNPIPVRGLVDFGLLIQKIRKAHDASQLPTENTYVHLHGDPLRGALPDGVRLILEDSNFGIYQIE